ncbi:MAG: GNAT family N-acetyltransferase [Terrabacter sp.]
MSEFSVRQATVADVEEVVELRALMFSAMGVPGVADPGWRAAAAEWLGRELGGAHVRVVLAESREGRVVAGAMGTLRFETPSPTNPNGVRGLISNVATQPEARRQGLARDCVVGVLHWLRDDTAATVVELFATGEGTGLYEDLGFTRTAWPAMRLHLPR